MTRCLKIILLCAAVALPAVASAHDRMPRGPAGRWVEYGYSTYPRGDYPPTYRGYSGYAGYSASYWTPGPRVYVYPHGHASGAGQVWLQATATVLADMLATATAAITIPTTSTTTMVGDVAAEQGG